MKYEVTFNCRPYGALGIYHVKKTVSVEAANRREAIDIARLECHNQRLETQVGPEVRELS